MRAKISKERIWHGDPPVPGNGYCPFPKDIWPDVDRVKYYRALNNIVGGILCKSMVAHIDGLMELFELGDEYCEFVKSKYKPITAKNIYYVIRSGTGSFLGSVFWVHNSISVKNPNVLLLSPGQVLAICTSAVAVPDWQKMSDLLTIGNRFPNGARLVDFSRKILAPILDESDEITSDAVKRLLSSYTLSMEDFWKAKDGAITYGLKSGILIPKKQPTSASSQYWMRDTELLIKLYKEWTKPNSMMIDCSLETFTQWMTTLKSPKPSDRIRWMGRDVALARWIKALDETNFLCSPRWEKVVKTFKDRMGAPLNISSLKSASSAERKNRAPGSPYWKTVDLLRSWN